MMRDKTLYAATVEVSKEFLGPAGERFIRRQIVTHLAIEPEALQTKHMAALVDWVRLTFAVLTDNTQHVDDFSAQLLALTKQRPARPRLAKVAHGDRD